MLGRKRGRESPQDLTSKRQRSALLPDPVVTAWTPRINGPRSSTPNSSIDGDGPSSTPGTPGQGPARASPLSNWSWHLSSGGPTPVTRRGPPSTPPHQISFHELNPLHNPVVINSLLPGMETMAFDKALRSEMEDQTMERRPRPSQAPSLGPSALRRTGLDPNRSENHPLVLIVGTPGTQRKTLSQALQRAKEAISAPLSSNQSNTNSASSMMLDYHQDHHQQQQQHHHHHHHHHHQQQQHAATTASASSTYALLTSPYIPLEVVTKSPGSIYHGGPALVGEEVLPSLPSLILFTVSMMDRSSLDILPSALKATNHHLSLLHAAISVASTTNTSMSQSESDPSEWINSIPKAVVVTNIDSPQQMWQLSPQDVSNAAEALELQEFHASLSIERAAVSLGHQLLRLLQANLV